MLNVQKPPLFSHHSSIHNAGATWAVIRDSITHPLRHFLWRCLLSSWLHVLISINPVKLSTALSVSGSDITKALSLSLTQLSLWTESSSISQPMVEISFLMCVGVHTHMFVWDLWCIQLSLRGKTVWEIVKLMPSCKRVLIQMDELRLKASGHELSTVFEPAFFLYCCVCKA